MCFGLKKETLEKISGKMVLIRHVDQAIIFGSRAKGT
ncbi:MAG TPA: nucleotidyltransferase domain-containing protein, partial [Bacteroides sp.]|nr:nucleotidyltransferase domain-containing protein [Bacteroides sp.]